MFHFIYLAVKIYAFKNACFRIRITINIANVSLNKAILFKTGETQEFVLVLENKHRIGKLFTLQFPKSETGFSRKT